MALYYLKTMNSFFFIDALRECLIIILPSIHCWNLAAVGFQFKAELYLTNYRL